MKKRLVFVLTIAMVLPASMAFAGEANDPMAVTLISGPEEEEAEPVSLDDVKTDKEIEIDGFGNITFTKFEYLDDAIIDKTAGYKTKSGEEAEYACLYADILNTKTRTTDYLADVEVKAIYDDVYEYGGWAYMINRDVRDDAFLSSDDKHAYSVDPMYTGHYVFGVTLPNAVVNGKEELKMVVKVGGNEMTYFIRK